MTDVRQDMNDLCEHYALKSCDRCGNPLQRSTEGWRHTRYAKRGEVCLHPLVSDSGRRERGLRERYGALGGWVV